MTELAGRRVLVMGLGSFGGGAGAVRFLVGAGARVTVTDLRAGEQLRSGLESIADLDVELVLGAHRDQDFTSHDLVVANPAVRPHDRHLCLARESGARVVSEVELFLERTRARVVGITGTQGKSSTASMLAQLLEATGAGVRLGGNIGGSLLPEVERLTDDTVCVLELSSYQLEALSSPDETEDGRPMRAEVVAVTNVLADHLERHGTRESYARAKGRILELVGPSGTAILPSRDVFAELGLATPARTVRVGEELRIEDGLFRFGDEVLGAVEELALPGEFQRDNALVALGAARLLGAPAKELASAVQTLVGLEHRLEDLGEVRGRRIWDNGVSTTPDSTASALRSVPGTCVLLCGGRYKSSLPVDELVEAARGRVRYAVTFGESAPVLSEHFREGDVPSLARPTLREGLVTALESAAPGDAVLFSPACASFDAYANFRERALEFRALLEELA